MKDLFVIDAKDYNESGKINSRPSVRAVIYRDGKVLLVHSAKYNYYKFPGGGIEKGENHIEALVREVREESGYVIIPDSVTEYGRVLRRNKDSYNDDEIFEQENFYYFCKVQDETVERALDGYESDEGFEPVWMDPIVASRHNKYEADIEGSDPVMIKREAKVLDMADLELRKRARTASQEEFIKSLGNPQYGEMISFVRSILENTNTESGEAKKEIFYSRFEHTLRVLGWMLRLYEMSSIKDRIRYEDVIIATIFHDVGRPSADINNTSHAEAGVPITREYLTGCGFDKERTEFICELVRRHSDKHLMGKEEVDPNLMMLMEADLLDDMGALGVVMDCIITKGRNENATFTDCYDHIMRFTDRIQHDNPMYTPEGRRLWDDKTELVEDFVRALERDLCFYIK